MKKSQPLEQDDPPRLSRVVLGVCGGIAAYKTAELVRVLVKDGVTVDVVLTSAGAWCVIETTFQALSGRPVRSDLWESGAPTSWGISRFRAPTQSSWRRRPQISSPSLLTA
jgi:phosphopantothenoylcysteine synthetase/decarboxylase